MRGSNSFFLLTKYERGTKVPSLGTVAKLAAGLGVPAFQGEQTADALAIEVIRVRELGSDAVNRAASVLAALVEHGRGDRQES